jgi:hypothetical protein
MIKFNLNLEISFEKENHFTISYENVEKFLLENVNEFLKKDNIKIERPKVTSSLETY